MPQVTMPDGAVVEMPDQLDPALAARLRAYQQSQQAPGDGGPEFGNDVPVPGAEAPNSREPSFGDFDMNDPVLSMFADGIKKIFMGAPETAATMVNNGAVQTVAGLTAPFVSNGDDDSADFIRDFTAEHSYTPRGESARQLTAGLGEAMEPFENVKKGLGDTIMEYTGSPGAATAAYMAPDIASILLGPKPTPKGAAADLTAPGADLSGGAARRTKPVNRPDPSDPVATARAAGYKLLPSQVEQATLKKPGLGDRIAEAIAPEDTRRDFVLDNQRATQQLVREKAKAPEGATFDEAGLDKQREPHYQAYRDVEKAVEVVPPSEDYLFALDDATQRAKFKKGVTPSVTEVISALRTKARKKINNPNADESIAQDGALDREAADALEDALGKRLEELGDTESLTKYQEARKSLAELNDIDEASQGGITDASKLRRRDDKTQKRMTGQTKMVADVAQSFPDATKSSLSAAGRKGAPGIPESREGVIKKTAKAAARGTAKVLGLGDRLLVESEGFQNRMGKPANATERTYFDEYGREPELASSPGAVNAERGLDFSEKTNVMPPKKGGLGDDLQLLQDVENPDVLPDTPDTLSADTPRATESGGLTFKGSPEVKPARRPAGRDDFDFEEELPESDLGIDVRTNTQGAPGKQELSDLIASQKSGDTKLEPLGGRAIREETQTDMIGDSDKSAPLQLTKPNQRAKVTAASDKRGNVTVRHSDGGEITAIELPDQGTMQIKDSKVPDGSRGEGRGQAMAQQLISMAKKKGLRLVSDNRVSESAQAMWAALKRKGLKIKQNPATRNASGELVSKSELKPVFEIVDDLVTE